MNRFNDLLFCWATAITALLCKINGEVHQRIFNGNSRVYWKSMQKKKQISIFIFNHNCLAEFISMFNPYSIKPVYNRLNII